MKIAILTFHWATNYGAVLQAYALQHYLTQLGNEVEIINYYPSKYKKSYFNALITKRINKIHKRLIEVKKEKKIDSFRKKHLNITEYFNSSNKLNSISDNYDCFICGSDQIWNPSFLQYGEKGKTYVYFLDFVSENKIKASYAGSFGVTEYPDTFCDELKKKFQRFDCISVRENSGRKIINNLGISDVEIVPDPTILLKTDAYMSLVNKNIHNAKYICTYMLHNQKIKSYEMLYSQLKDKNCDIIENNYCAIEDWLSNIFNSEMVVTNSFHGIVFSILFKKNFIALPIKGSGMNDRLYTILNKLGLQDRIYDSNDFNIDALIDWDEVHRKLENYRSDGYKYINKILDLKKS